MAHPADPRNIRVNPRPVNGRPIVGSGVIAPTGNPRNGNPTLPQRAPARYQNNQRIVGDWDTPGVHYIIEDKPGSTNTTVGPKNEQGTTQQVNVGNDSGWIASIEFPEGVGRDINGVLFVDSPDIQNSDSPWAVNPDLINGGSNTPLGGCLPVGVCVYGHEGVSQTQYFNVNPGACQRIAVNAESARIGILMVPKFFIPNDTVPTLRTYTVAPGEPLTNRGFNTPNSGQLRRLCAAVGGTQNAILTTSGQASGFFSSGFSGFVDSGSRPRRSFYGSVPIDAAARHSFSICPVGWNASHVQLTAGGIDGAGNNYGLVMYLAQRGLSATPPDGLVGPFTSADGPIPLIDTVSIWVTSNAASSGTGSEPVFCLDYFWGL